MKEFITKWERGRTVIIGGHSGSMFAIYNSISAAKVSGCGMIVACTDKKYVLNLESQRPNCKVYGLDLENISDDKFRDLIEKSQSILLGIGSNWSQDTYIKIIREIRKNNRCVVIVLDGGAINSSTSKILKKYKNNHNILLVLNQYESYKFLDECQPSDSKLIKTCKDFQCNILHKGSGLRFISHNGTLKNIQVESIPEMAVAGMGDLLSGLIAGFVASGHDIRDATINSILIRQHSAVLLSNMSKSKFLSISPEQIINIMPKAIYQLDKRNRLKFNKKNTGIKIEFKNKTIKR